jgi:hypothetical protein
MPLETTMGAMPADLEAAAMAADTAVGDTIASLIPRPERPYSPRVATSLAKAIAKVMAALGVEMTAEEYTGPVEEFSPDEARFLAMLEAAAADYGKPLPIKLADIKGDAELTAITAALSALADDADFMAFLDEGGGEEGAMEKPEGPEIEIEVKPGAAKPAGDDFFAKRMR